MELQNLRLALIELWKSAFSEINTLKMYEKEAISSVFSLSSRYELDNCTSTNKITAGGKVSKVRPAETENYYEYGLDTEGYVVYSKSQHAWNKVYWAGFYKRAADSIEYIEFNLNTRVPSKVQRVTFEKGRIISRQTLIINGGGGQKITQPIDTFMETILNNPHALFIDVQVYLYENDNVFKVVGLSEMDDLMPFTYTDFYKYDEFDKLSEIKTHYANGQIVLKYIKPKTKTSINEQVNIVAEKLANWAINKLKNTVFDSPLAFLHLHYRCVVDYLPYIIPATEKGVEKSKKEKDFHYFTSPTDISFDDWIKITDDDIPEEFQVLIQTIHEKENWDSGTKMLL